MDEAVHKADILVEALGWIRQFRGRYVVIKLGGSVLDEKDAVRSFLTDVIFLASVGMKPILVHGGGKSISHAMTTAGIQPRFVQGRRYTDERTLEIVANTLAEICGSLLTELRRQGAGPPGSSYLGRNCLIGRKLSLEGPHGEVIDLGRVGEVVDVDRTSIEEATRGGAIPVIPSIALDSSGGKLNVNADTAAAAAGPVFSEREKLVFLSDVPGIFLDRKDPATLISHLPASLCRGLIVEGIIDSGMVPKVEAALDALRAGVRKVHIVDAATPHTVLLEFYSDKGVGTEIVP